MPDNSKRLLEASLNISIPKNKSVSKTDQIMQFFENPKGIYADHFCELYEKTLNSLIGSSSGKEELEYYKWLDFNYLREINQSSANLAKALKNKGYVNLLVVGMGGSGINALVLKNALYDNAEYKAGKPYIDVHNNIDPSALNRKLSFIKETDKLSKTAFAFISKSGNTDEVTRNIYHVLDFLTENNESRKLAIEQFAKQAVFITEINPNNQLNKLRKEIKELCGIEIALIEHHPEIGGRYSMFSPVGMFPAQMMGLDTNRLLIGAESSFEDLTNSKELENSQVGKLALYDIIFQRQGYRNRYSMVYSDSLEALNKFRAQLKGESLNKNGIDSTMHLAGIGTVNHHSDMELLFKDGNQVVLEQILFKNPIKDHQNTYDEIKCIEDYQGQSAHISLIQGHILPIYQYLIDNKHPVFITVIDEQNEESLAYYLMQDMLVTVMQAGLQDKLDDAIRQHEVEKYKKSIKEQIKKNKSKNAKED